MTTIKNDYIEDAVALHSSLVEDFDVAILENGRVRVFDRNGKTITLALKQAISRHFYAFCLAVRADEASWEAIERARAPVAVEGSGHEASC